MGCYELFISYRRRDDVGRVSGRDQARLIADRLNLRFRTFFDYDSITDGNFENIIIPAIKSCKVFILFLTPGSLNRCFEKSDWVRREIQTAIRSKCVIINVTSNYSFNWKDFPEQLPRSISKIKRIHISNIDFEQLFEVSVNKLITERIVPNLIYDGPLITSEQYKIKVAMLVDDLNDDLKKVTPEEREKCKNFTIASLLALCDYSSIDSSISGGRFNV